MKFVDIRKKEELIAYDNASMRIQDLRGERELAEEQGIEKGEQKKEAEAVVGFYENNIPISIIANALKITEEKVAEIIKENKK